MKRSSGFQIDTSWGSRQTQINRLGDQIDQLKPANWFFYSRDAKTKMCIGNTLYYIQLK